MSQINFIWSLIGENEVWEPNLGLIENKILRDQI
jgi:hypothetical protein